MHIFNHGRSFAVCQRAEQSLSWQSFNKILIEGFVQVAVSESANLFESFRRVARSCEAKTFAYSGAQGESRSLTFGAALFLRRPLSHSNSGSAEIYTNFAKDNSLPSWVG
jgi:hypothetical protein